MFGRALALASSFVASHVQSQQLPEAEVKPFSDVCRLDRRIRLPVDDDSSYPAQIESITIDARGRLYLVGSDGGSAYVLDSLGRPVQRIGRRGRGPGEFQFVRQVTRAQSGRLYVLDQVGMAIGVLDFTGTRELRRIPTRGVGGRRMVLLDDSIPVVSGHYRDEKQVVAYTPDGDVLWSRGELPALTRQLRPRLDLSFITALPNGQFIAGSGLVPELWSVSARGQIQLPLRLAGSWKQLKPFVGATRDRAAAEAWLSASTLTGDAVTVGAHTVAFGFGWSIAIVNISTRTTWVLRDAPGLPAAGQSSRLLLRLPSSETENLLAWYTCRLLP